MRLSMILTKGTPLSKIGMIVEYQCTGKSLWHMSSSDFFTFSFLKNLKSHTSMSLKIMVFFLRILKIMVLNV
jgi:hypothetical protein